MRRAALIVVAVACGKPASDQTGRIPSKDSTMTATTTTTWRPTTLRALGLELDVMEGAMNDQGTAGDLRYFSASADGVHVNAWSGPGQDLAGWRARLVNRRPQTGPEATLTLCGRTATRQEAALDEERATGSFRGSDDAIGHLEHHVPPQVQVAVAGTLADGAPLLVVWTVVADERAARRADEDHFFASIRCR